MATDAIGNVIPETSGLANSMVMKKTNPNLMFDQSYYNQNNTAGVDTGYDYSGVKTQPVATPTVDTTKTKGLGSLFPDWLTFGTNNAGDGLGNYGTYTDANGGKIGINESAYDAMNSVGTDGLSKNSPGWFDVAPGSQTSKFGSTMSGIGAGIQGLTGLGSLYYENKKYGLQKQAAELEKDKYARAVKADKSDQANKALMAKNAGNGASYIGY